MNLEERWQGELDRLRGRLHEVSYARLGMLRLRQKVLLYLLRSHGPAARGIALDEGGAGEWPWFAPGVLPLPPGRERRPRRMTPYLPGHPDYVPARPKSVPPAPGRTIADIRARWGLGDGAEFGLALYLVLLLILLGLTAFLLVLADLPQP